MKTRELWSSKATSLETQNGWKSTNHKQWLFEPVVVNFCFLRGPLRRHGAFRFWLTSQKNAKSWDVLDIAGRVLSETAVTEYYVVKGGALMFSGQHIIFWISSSRFKPCYGAVSLELRCINGYQGCTTGVNLQRTIIPSRGEWQYS